MRAESAPHWLAAHEAMTLGACCSAALLILAAMVVTMFRAPSAASRNVPAASVPLARVRASIVGIAGEFQGVTIPVPADGLLLGRVADSPGCLAFPEGSDVSRRHCTIAWDSASRQFVVVDVGSTNGTFAEAEGRRLVRDHATRLDLGARIRIGNDNVFELTLR